MIVCYKHFMKIGVYKSLRQCALSIGTTNQNLHFLNKEKGKIYRYRDYIMFDPRNTKARALFKELKLAYLVAVCPSPSLAERAVNNALRMIQNQLFEQC